MSGDTYRKFDPLVLADKLPFLQTNVSSNSHIAYICIYIPCAKLKTFIENISLNSCKNVVWHQFYTGRVNWNNYSSVK